MRRFDDPPDETPYTMSPEELTRRIGAQKPVNIILILLAIAALIMAGIALGRPASKPAVIAHPNAVDSLQAEVAALRGDLAYLKAHTDTTGVSDMREQVQTLTSLVEQRASDLDNLRRDVNHLEIQGTPRAK